MENPNDLDLARESVYRFLAGTLSPPRTRLGQMIKDPANVDLVRESIEVIRAVWDRVPVKLGFGELPAEHLRIDLIVNGLQRPVGEIQEEYDRVFGLSYSPDCSPYETEYYQNAEPFFRAQQLADIAGFYRAFGIEPGSDLPDRPDHIAYELEFLAFVLTKKRDANAADQVVVCDDIFRKFFRDHIVWWVPSFATGLRRKGEGSMYAGVAELLAAFLPVERAGHDVPAPRIPLQAVEPEQPSDDSECGTCTTCP